MVISDIRRRILEDSKKTASSYIQLDLIFQLDGLEKGSNPGKWTDLKNGYVFLGNATELANGWDFNGSQGLICNGENGITQLNSNRTWTIEIAMHLKNPKQWGAIFNTNWNFNSRNKHFCILLGFASSTYALNCGNSGYHDGVKLHGYKINANSDVVWSTFCNKTTSVLNTNLINYNYNNNTLCGNGGYMQIGTRNNCGSGFAYATIYAIRVYNRELTPAEMQYNQQLDIERFKLNI